MQGIADGKHAQGGFGRVQAVAEGRLGQAGGQGMVGQLGGFRRGGQLSQRPPVEHAPPRLAGIGQQHLADLIVGQRVGTGLAAFHQQPRRQGRIQGQQRAGLVQAGDGA